ncbi:hypothetical protein ABS71_11885 [bacterium SCN 62-11]|nr:hypothetical protein [Candidatus Eremiobacteraeota bacterium]ODT65952.1 MAG: hypothetical protein ABS71_11885 [bacterium SCN 62-11]
MSHPLGSAPEQLDAPSPKNPFATAYLVLAGTLVPLLCILVEILDNHPCRRQTEMDPLQYPWQGISIVAVSLTHLLYLIGVRDKKLWPLLFWSLLTCCGYTVWFAPSAPLGFYAGLKGLLMFGPLSALISTLILIHRSSLPKPIFWMACLTGWSCLSYALKLSGDTVFHF